MFSEHFTNIKETIISKMPNATSNKWIVLTTVNHPTKDVEVCANIYIHNKIRLVKENYSIWHRYLTGIWLSLLI